MDQGMHRDLQQVVILMGSHPGWHPCQPEQGCQRYDRNLRRVDVRAEPAERLLRTEVLGKEVRRPGEPTTGQSGENLLALP